ncbi:TonB family protein [Sphingomonas parva]|uniref:TonB family protein n=1 Tax=Sphingomonas parva TaxID=2555898 RepID=A0A4Y8ZNT1_9SPHN|nr:TonB family protein [Sphingomonas parva]TFI56805.1 TonB family protein [Sphingomonas parva]
MSSTGSSMNRAGLAALACVLAASSPVVAQSSGGGSAPRGSLSHRVEAQPLTTVPAPVPPPPLPPEASKARLRAPVDFDYPGNALRAEEEGTIGFEVHVGPDGRASACIVTATSGSAALDEAVCRTMRMRSRFIPARAASGEPLPDLYAGSVTFSLPADEAAAAPMESNE